MAEYKIEFYDSADVLQETITEIWDVSISENSLTSINFFLIEPRRIKLNVFKTDFLSSYILPATYQSGRDISNYYAKFYIDNVAILTGYIDLKYIGYDKKTDIVSIMIIQLTGLLNVYSDLQVSSDVILQGTTLPELMDEFVSDVKDKVGFYIWSQDDYLNPTDYLSNQQIDTEDINAYQSSVGYVVVHNGFKYVYSTELEEHFWYYIKYTTVFGDKDIAPTLRIYRIMLPMQFALVESVDGTVYKDVDENGDDITRYGALEIWERLDLYGITSVAQIDALPITMTHHATTFTIVGNHLEMTGQLFAPVFNPKYYVSSTYATSDSPYTQYSPITYFNVMKALLLATNHSVTTNTGRIITVVPKTPEATDIIEIASADIISSQRIYMSKINTPVRSLNVLSGNVKTFKEKITNYYGDFFEQKIGKRFIIDDLDKYNIELFNTIEVDSINYQVHSINKDYVRDEYNLIAWKV